MSSSSNLIFFHNPQSRSNGVFVLLEELKINYELRLIDFKKQDEYKDEFKKINPMSKIPTIVHDGSVITEQAAIYLYLADQFSYGNLAPKIGSKERGGYLRWMVFYGSCFEPAVVDKSMGRETPPSGRSPYGSFDTMFATLREHISQNQYFCGSQFTAADVLWGSALDWVTKFQLIEKDDVIARYLEDVVSRPAFAATSKKNEELIKKLC